jgi:hypothetical protein
LDVSGDRQSKTFIDRSFGGCRQNSLRHIFPVPRKSNYPSASFRGTVLFAASQDYKAWKHKGSPFQHFGGIDQNCKISSLAFYSKSHVPTPSPESKILTPTAVLYRIRSLSRRTKGWQVLIVPSKKFRNLRMQHSTIPTYDSFCTNTQHTKNDVT